MPAVLLPNGKQQFIDINGRPLVGGTVGMYVVGTLIPKPTWQNSGKTVLNTNPIILDSRGQALIYGNGAYRQIVKDSHGNLIWDEPTESPFSDNYYNAINLVANGGDPTGVEPTEGPLASCLAIATDQGGGTIYVPTGTYSFPVGGVTWADNVNLVFERGAVFNLGNTSTNALLIGTPNNCLFQGVNIKGGWATLQNPNGNRAISMTGGSNLDFSYCVFDAMRNMTLVVTSATGVRIDHCTITRSAIDCINLQDCTDVIVTNNIIRYGGDNGIACSFLQITPAHSSIIIKDNILEDTFGINCLGGKHLVIQGNVLKRSKGHCIEVAYETSFFEGYSTVVSVDISGNEMTDLINGSYVGAGNVAQYIYVAGFTQAGGLAKNVFRPSNNASGNPIPQPPFGGFSSVAGGSYDYNSGRLSTSPTIPSGHAITITNNTVLQTVQGGVAPSVWGFNSDGLFSRTGWINTAVSSTLLVGAGIYIGANVRHTIIANNILMPGLTGIFFGASGLDVLGFEGIDVIGNKIFNAIAGGISTDAGSSLTVGMRIENNTINCDPYFESTNRTGQPNGPFDGTWANAVVPAAIEISNLNGVQIGNNHFWNCAVAIHASSSTYEFTSTNWQHCNPAAVNYSGSNGGIGNISPCANGSMSYVVEDCNPTNTTTYGTVLNYAPTMAPSGTPPSSGSHVAGWVVPVQNPTPSAGKTLIAYYRATTGSGNVDGTDWIHSVTTTS